MSNLDNIIDKIESTAKETASEILNKAEIENKTKLDEEIIETEKIAKEIIRRAEEDSLQIKDTVTASVNREARDIVLTAKQDVVDKVFDLAKERLVNISDSDFKNVLVNFLEKYEIPDGAIVEVPKNRNISDIGGVSIVEVEGLRSGFRILKDGISDNYDFEKLVDYFREDLEEKVIDMISER